MEQQAFGTTQDKKQDNKFALPFGLTPIMIPEPRQFPKIAVEEADDTSQKPSKKKQKKDHNVRFKDVLCEVFEIPNRKTLRELAAMVSPVAVEAAAAGSKTPSNGSVTAASDFQADPTTNNIVFVSAASLQILIQRTREVSTSLLGDGVSALSRTSSVNSRLCELGNNLSGC